jgi:hypothetical protein
MPATRREHGDTGRDGAGILIFTHIPRTGGTTLRTIIRRQYPTESVLMLPWPRSGLERFHDIPAGPRSQLEAILGHRMWGVHEELSVAARYITLLHDPVDRVISFYYWVRSLPGHDLHNCAMEMSLEDFVRSGILQAIDEQTRYISGRIDSSSEDALEIARHNLTHEYLAFGLREHFDASVLLFRKRLGWRSVAYERQGQVHGRLARDAISERTLRIIEERNAFDLRLYAFAVERFGEMVKREGESFPWEVERMMRRDRATD